MTPADLQLPERKDAPVEDPAVVAGKEAHEAEAAFNAVPGSTPADEETPLFKAAVKRMGEADNAFCAVRPPGHHAEPARSMGFCLFNNVAVGALQARAVHGHARVAVIDFDVHHGNGTQAMFARDASLFYGSTHQFPHYPGTGAADETGVGNLVNVPLAPFTGSAEFRAAMTDTILPALRGFDPGFIIISAGFDAHRSDPLAQLELTEADYGWVTAELLQVADETCAGRVVSTLEGGYDLGALASSVGAHVSALMASSKS
ncbi:MAG: histone deacetylase family protein [Proteobacteria bacterium]|nr:histone deacetylase family protein [Pseudomonadota bacterium]